MIPTVIKLEDKNYNLIISAKQLAEVNTKPSLFCDLLNKYEYINVKGYNTGTINNGGQQIENSQSEGIISVEIYNTSTTDYMFDKYILTITRKILLNLYKEI